MPGSSFGLCRDDKTAKSGLLTDRSQVRVLLEAPYYKKHRGQTVMDYLFKEPLIEGTIKSRPNRFIMNVLVDGKVEKSHCPSTGRIGNLKFEEIPCLLSRSHSPDRKTKYTVEAFLPGRAPRFGEELDRDKPDKGERIRGVLHPLRTAEKDAGAGQKCKKRGKTRKI